MAFSQVHDTRLKAAVSAADWLLEEARFIQWLARSRQFADAVANDQPALKLHAKWPDQA
jgi:hypothetical protein